MLQGMTAKKAIDATITPSYDPSYHDIQRLLENALKNEKFADILARVFSHLSAEEIMAIEKNTEKLFEENARRLKNQSDIKKSKEENSYLFHKVSFAITMTIIGTYFGGPIATTCTSSLFTRVYTIIFGIPNSNSLLYGMFFSPCLQLLTSISKQFGPYVVGAFAATSSYSAASALEFISKRIHQIHQLVQTKKNIKNSPPNADEILAEFELMSLTQKNNDLDDLNEESFIQKNEGSDGFNEESFTLLLPRFESQKKSKNHSWQTVAKSLNVLSDENLTRLGSISHP